MKSDKCLRIGTEAAAHHRAPPNAHSLGPVSRVPARLLERFAEVLALSNDLAPKLIEVPVHGLIKQRRWDYGARTPAAPTEDGS